MEGYKLQDFSFLHLSEKLVQQEWPIRDIGFGVMDATNIRVFFLLKRVSNMKPKVSIIVPVYNVEKYLDRRMESLINQTLKEIEIILVDDGSPDNCPQMCDDYAKKDSRVKVVHKQNAGLGYARNSGLDVASGEYVAFVDSDDCVDLDTYNLAYNACKKYDLDILGFSYNRFCNKEPNPSDNNLDNITIIDNFTEIRKCAPSIFGDVPGYDTKNHYITGSAWMSLYKRIIIEDNNLRFKSERQYISEDFYFNFELLQYVRRAGRCNCTWYHYRVNPASLTKIVRLDRLDRNEEFANSIEQLMLKYGYGKESKLFSMANFIASLRASQKSVMLSNLSIKEKKDWFFNKIPFDLINSISKDFPVKRLSFHHHLIFNLTKHKLFILQYVYFYVIFLIRNLISVQLKSGH